jgi:predicted regulator of Ras-like GTPase activity (Roadblock/LC7/MglB family)
VQVVAIPSAEWQQYSEQAHLICFNEHRAADMNRIDFALVADLDGVPQAYMTCREVDSETVYMQYGGAFPSAKGSIKSFRGYEAMLKWLASNYKYGTTLIENTNTAMLRFAMQAGLRIIGVRNFKQSILLEHFAEFEKAVA